MTLQRLYFLGLGALLSLFSKAQCPPQSLPYSEDFDTGLGCFTAINGGTSADTWGQHSAGGNGNYFGDLDGSGHVSVDSDDAGSGNVVLSETLESPIIDAGNITGSLFLSFDHYFRSIGASDSGRVQVYDSTAWVTVYSTSASVGAFGSPVTESIDISAYANSNLQVRFQYYDNGSWAWYWLVDNFDVVEITCPAPTAVNLNASSDTSFSVSYGGTPDTIFFEWGPVGFTQGSGCMGGVATNGASAVSISNSDAGVCGSLLTSGGCYDVYIARNCAAQGGASAYAGPFTICTSCVSQSLPYIENFDIGLGCFTVTDGGTSTDTWAHHPAGGNGNYSGDLDGTGHLSVDSDDAGSAETLNEVLTSPPIDASGLSGSLFLEFDQYFNSLAASDSGTVEVFDGTNWNVVYSVNTDLGSFSQPDRQSIDISSYANAALQVRFTYRDGATWAWWWLIDNFEVREVLCAPSSNLNSVLVGADSVALAWTPSSATNFIIEYGLAGFTLGTGTTTVVSGSSAGIGGLSPQTAYDFYLTDSCINGLGTTLGPLNITTGCPVVSVPYSEDFDNGPGCFTVTDGGTTLDTWSNRPAGGNFNYFGDIDGTAHMSVDSDGAGSGARLIETLSSPIIDASAFSSGALFVSFDQVYRNSFSDSALVQVYDGANWVTVASYNSSRGAFSAPDSVTINVSAYANANFQVRFFYDDNNSWAWWWLIDNFEVQGFPCGVPSNLDTLSVGTNSASLNWASNGSLWNINWGPAGFRQGTQVTGSVVKGISTKPYNLTGLSPNTCYDFYVQDSCTAGNGPWSGPFSFCTDVSCFAPTSGSAVATSANTASFSWSGNAANYQVNLVQGTGTIGSGTLSLTSSTSTVLNNLAPATNYCAYVRAICAPGDTSVWAGPFCFNTACNVLTAPFIEDFEGATTSCWTNDTIQGANLWTVAVGSSGGSISTAHGGSFNARFTSSSGGPFITRYISPIIDASALSSTELSFWYGQENWFGDQNSLAVYYRTSPTGSWNFLWSDASDVSSWTKATVAIPSTSSTLQLAFEGTDQWGYANVLDDVRIDIPGGSVICPQPSNIAATNPNCNGVTLNWNSASGGSIIEFGPVGFTPGNGQFTGIVSPPYTITSMMPSTNYELYVADTCGFQDTGVFVGPVAISTNNQGLATAAFSATPDSANLLRYTFDASASSGAINSYLWDFGDGNVGIGATTNHTYAAAGQYSVELVVRSDCGDDTLIQTLVDVSLTELIWDQLSVYPNPTKGKLNLSWQGPTQRMTLGLRDASGRWVLQRRLEVQDGDHQQLDLTHLATGVYLLQIDIASEQYKGKIILKP
jgi:hypothetical protein